MHFVSNRGQFAIACSAERHVLMGLGASAYRAEHLRSIEHQLDRTICLLRGHRGQYDVGPNLPLATKSTSNKQGDYMDITFPYAKGFRQRFLHA